jgi:Helix-turn-helix domain
VDELACFSEVSRQRVFERFELLRPHLEDGRPRAAIAREGGLSYRTLQYWLERYRTYGLVGLVPKQRTDRGRRRKLSGALEEAGLPSRGQPPKCSLASRSHTARYRVASIGARRDENGEAVAHRHSGRLQPSGCGVFSLMRIPIFTQHCSCFATGNFGAKRIPRWKVCGIPEVLYRLNSNKGT